MNLQRRLMPGFRQPEPAPPDPCHRRGAWMGAATTDLWDRAAARLETDAVCGARVLLVGFPEADQSDMLGQLRELGVGTVGAMSETGQLIALAAAEPAFSHLVVNFDACEDTETGIETLLALRKGAPGLAVVLCSAMVRGDDLGTERSAICDATLRLPVSLPRLRAGLKAASRNHENHEARPSRRNRPFQEVVS